MFWKRKKRPLPARITSALKEWTIMVFYAIIVGRVFQSVKLIALSIVGLMCTVIIAGIICTAGNILVWLPRKLSDPVIRYVKHKKSQIIRRRVIRKILPLPV